MKVYNGIITRPTGENFQLLDVTEDIRRLIEESGVQNGVLTVLSRHTTAAVAVNEFEERLLADIRNYFSKLAPSEGPYLHNDIHLRDCPPDEPENAHSHLIALMLGNSESIGIREGELVLGKYQSVLLVELDGPRERELAVTIVGE